MAVRGEAPGGPGPHPAVLLLSGDGTCKGAEAQRLIAALSSWAVVVALDLPLCGARASDKLSAVAFDPQHPLAQRLRPDLVTQLEADLDAVRTALEARDDVDSKRVGVLAWGRGVELLGDWSPQGFAHVERAPAPPDDALAARLRRAL